MKVLIVDIDSTIKNVALEKIRLYHQLKGDEIVYNLPLYASICDKIYVSCVFEFNNHLCKEWEGKAEIGGTGVDLLKTLPPEIDEMKPKINIGFTTRGCVHKCYFCVVPRKEGKIRVTGDIYDFWDGKSKKIVLLDNNILGLPEQFLKISAQIKKENLRVDFNGGMDFRLITDDLCKEIFSMKHLFEIRFAFDDYSYKPKILKALEMLRRNGMKDWSTRWYIYVGVKDTFDTVLERCNIIHSNKQLCYIMRDRDPIVQENKQFIALAKWTNWAVFFKYEFFDVVRKSHHFADYRPYFGMNGVDSILDDITDNIMF